MRIAVAHLQRFTKNGVPIETYGRSWCRVLRERGHNVVEVQKEPFENKNMYKRFDLLLDIDSGRNDKGQLRWHGENEKVPCLSAVYLIDSHNINYSNLHKNISKNYNHNLFAVWAKRDLFKNHSSANWAPNFSDLKWFNGEDYKYIKPEYDFNFIGSKGGLNRANELIRICKKNNWTYNVKQVAATGKQQWPYTAQEISRSKFGFNKSQKRDGPNLRVIETMLMKLPLICDQHEESGLDLLFKPWIHYIPYNYNYSGLEEAMRYCIENEKMVNEIAEEAYKEVKTKHLIENRVDQLLQVINK